MATKKSLSHPGPRSLKTPKASAGWRWQAPRNAWLRTPQAVARPAGAQGAGIVWLPTLLAKGPARLQPEHLRRQPASAVQPCLHVIALDTSGSMRQGGRLARAKGYAARVIEQAARAGDLVALLGFGGQGVQLLLPPGPARTAGAARVRPLGGGGGTPLAAGLAEADRLLRTARQRRGTAAPSCLWLLTDGRTLEQPTAPAAATHVVVVDFDDPLRPVGRCAAWAARWQAEHRTPESLSF
ncbi:VWA domain-containing protein [Acidovorax sp. sic0104]|uniref:vWA domain-containing protein n=1 Tax=Acidovorax sp. sic0104 TaxID=2854784 RepID=UPI001C48CD57|nr:VWA domain-containing protein [Acidovorax sp. sic0104]MBV7543120.1 VWA domain-containing protein [Acidovorax sp. sic0104]